MDTISMKLEGNITELEKIVKCENKMKGISAIRNCILTDGSISLIMSYPKFHSSSNAFLITTKKECLLSQGLFLEELEKFNININLLIYKVTRADIPFTFEMEKGESFNSYYNTFKYIALISEKVGIKNIKSYSDFIPNEIETINFKKNKDSDWSLTIYNQDKKFIDKYNPDIHKGLVKKFPNLPSRIRLEVKKNIKRAKSYPLTEFRYRNLFEELFKGHQKYLLKFFNVQNLNLILREEKNELIELLKERHNSSVPFTWYAFIERHASKAIKSDRPIKEAIEYIGLTYNSKTEIIGKINSTLNYLKTSSNIDLKSTIDKFQKIRICIENYKFK